MTPAKSLKCFTYFCISPFRRKRKKKMLFFVA